MTDNPRERIIHTGEVGSCDFISLNMGTSEPETITYKTVGQLHIYLDLTLPPNAYKVPILRFFGSMVVAFCMSQISMARPLELHN